MKKYSVMAMYDGIIPEHRDVYLAEDVEAEIYRLVSMLEYVVDPDVERKDWEAIIKLINNHKGE